MSSPTLYFMWIAEYTDGTRVPQFNPETGKENKADPDWLPSMGVTILSVKEYDEESLVRQLKSKGARVKRFGWYNFSPQMAAALQAQGHKVISTYPPISVVLNVKEGEEVVAARRTAKQWGMAGAGGRIYDRGFGPTIYVLGIKDKSYVFISEDGTIEVSSDFNYK